MTLVWVCIINKSYKSCVIWSAGGSVGHIAMTNRGNANWKQLRKKTVAFVINKVKKEMGLW